MRLVGKAALVTGASRGIGRMIALTLAREGCMVAVNYHKNQEKAEAIVNDIRRRMGGRAIAVKGDVSNRKDIETMFRHVIDEFEKIDILVTNAGIYIPSPILETSDEVWDLTLDVNLKGVFMCIRETAKYMVPRKYGKIINISSNSGFGAALWGDASYAVSKAGVIQLTKNAAYELGQYGINVNCVAPAAIDTDMLKGDLDEEGYRGLLEAKKELSSLGQIGKPEDVANAVLFFACDASDFITGKTLLVDGGRRDYL
jgi:3-oxoacyl-[acyl-carrier protein] reductase